LLITDLKMPGVDGLTVIREARRLKADIPVIIITGFSTEASAIEAVNLGVSGYLTKPFRVPRVLAVLARYHVPATFCLIGRAAAIHPDLVKQVVDGGHTLANHTYTHPLSLAKQTEAQVRAEIGHAGDAIEAAAGGHRPTFFRAPGGVWSPAVLAECRAQGVHPLDWSVDPRDWSQPGVRHIVTTILDKTRPGAIVLEHDGGGNRDQTVSALALALPRLLHAGYTFVLVERS